MKALVLAYHSHNIAGAGYDANDHVAFASDLRTLTDAGARIVSATDIVDALAEGAVTDRGEVVVAITFDDGPRFDVDDFEHPQFGPQRSFLNIMRDFRRDHGERAQPGLAATCFVIASAEARHAMERAPECGYTYLRDWLADDWWPRAAGSGVMDLGNHSWDHVHPAPPAIATRSQVRGDFARVDNYEDADREIRAASDYINGVVGGRCRLFAFPFGHVNDYLVATYLPGFAHEHGMRGAFGVDSRAVAPNDSVWNIPRIVCGHHWKSPGELERYLRG